MLERRKKKEALLPLCPLGHLQWCPDLLWLQLPAEKSAVILLPTDDPAQGSSDAHFPPLLQHGAAFKVYFPFCLRVAFLALTPLILPPLLQSED